MGVDSCMGLLRSAGSFVDVGRAVRELLDIGAYGNAIELWARSGEPVVHADGVEAPPTIPADRAYYMETGFRVDPIRTALLETRRAAGADVMEPSEWMKLMREHRWRGPAVEPYYLPLVDDSGAIGAIRLGFVTPLVDSLRGDLARFAMHASIRFAKLGIGAAEDGAVLASLTLRQRQVARLATLDRTNREIADELDLSVDTVKKHLKDAFARLEITSRRDLRALFRRLTPVTDVPSGVTVIDGLHVARLDLADRVPKP